MVMPDFFFYVSVLNCLFIYIFIYTLFEKVDNHHLRNIRLNILQLFYIAMEIKYVRANSSQLTP